MNTDSKRRVLPLVAALVLIAAAACADMPTDPQVSGKRSVRDTTVAGDDSTTCLRGFVIYQGRVVCN
jgi:hypothetical protein